MIFDELKDNTAQPSLQVSIFNGILLLSRQAFGKHSESPTNTGLCKVTLVSGSAEQIQFPMVQSWRTKIYEEAVQSKSDYNNARGIIASEFQVLVVGVRRNSVSGMLRWHRAIDRRTFTDDPSWWVWGLTFSEIAKMCIEVSLVFVNLEVARWARLYFIL